ncbi:carboxylating nicotinate-nucleotide diphosphorylase [Commensalibacter oyaizuii]|uniref:nicotinate-nucleotide diphosphorylase (carboxylating) n=1 Tax=Commensalibacter oyaizuii TaxID=3043873 RepID=A0ABT6Q1J5_9PROT|nr:carboxylating nicotinate-nucleotide diphosphorylase [Commensalibacter sp. TBRC 16381]MDI2090359.1 carboxylating nicotinate-nucleotide diphosphorylase [Commensalibacter sp. TBRC 16381]
MSLPRLLIEPIIRNALTEDLGLAGDITSQAVIPVEHQSTVAMISRESGVLAGIDVAALSFELVDNSIIFEKHKQDGDILFPGTVIATVKGPSRSLLTGERTALNFISHLSGIASVTHQIVTSIKETKAQVVCTRKTTPGLRVMEKYAVKCGGGRNHRFALYDGILIKDNHIAIAGSVSKALMDAKSYAGHMVKIEIEVDTLEQLQEALSVGVDVVLLDNMSPDTLRKAVSMVNGQAITEASGRITPQTAPAIAASGVDMISVGWITHSASILDIGLDFI